MTKISFLDFHTKSPIQLIRSILLRILLVLGLFGVYRHSIRMNSQGLHEKRLPFELSESQPIASFRITFGLKDLSPKVWDGEVLADQSQLLQVEPDHFRSPEYLVKEFTSAGMRTRPLESPVLPADYLRNKTSWVCSTREASMHGPTTEWHVSTEKPKPVIQHPSILVHLFSGSLDQPVHIKTAVEDFSFRPQDLLAFKGSYFLERNVRVELVPPTTGVSVKRTGQQDFPALLASQPGKLWVAWQEYDDESDSVLVRGRTGESWGAVSVLADKSDVFQTAMGEDSHKRPWVIWAMQVENNWDLYGRVYDGRIWSQQERLTHHSGPDIYHKVVTDSQGRLWVVWQRTLDGFSQIFAKYYDGKQWSQEEQVSEGSSASGNNWWPAVAAGSNGSLAIAWDGYASGSYDVYLRRYTGHAWERVQTVAGTARFEAHPTVAIDDKNRTWVAWDESGIDWGKDTGFLVVRKGTQLHESRRIRIACRDGDQWMTSQGDLSQVLQPNEFWELPHLQIDAAGRPWLLVRHMVMRQPDTPLEGPVDLALWEILATRYDGSRWSELMYLPRSSGRNDMMPASATASDGSLWAVWATDLRNTKSYLPHQLQVQLGSLGKGVSEGPLALAPYRPEPVAFKPFQPKENEQVQRIRSYRIQKAGKAYSIYRGDLHRHTDISADGNNDGSLLDAYRYARDAAALDFVGVANHTDAVDNPYAWWRSQKVVDLFQMRNSFVALYGYERSVEYPNGHRNVFFAKRGAKITPVSSSEPYALEGSETLYWYLRRANGFSIPHTTGRTSGTDWRDNDPRVENLLELYQGMRDTYEYPGAPRPKRLWSQFLDASKPVPRASSSENSPSFRRLGFAWNALEKGYKLGFIASSDHISGHISYACLIAERLTPEGLLEAVRARRAYAATDNIILDIRHQSSEGEHLMGEIFSSDTPLRIQARILGSNEIQQIDLIKNGHVRNTYHPNQSQYNFEFVEPEMTKGESYYYVRVIQRDGEMAWGSPVWVTYRP